MSDAEKAEPRRDPAAIFFATQPRLRFTRETLLKVAVLVIAALAVYWPALRGDWLWDDDLDLTGNLALRSVAGLGQIWFDPSALYDYYPLKYTVQWIQWHLWHTDTLGYHLTNVALHVLSGGLFWRVLRRLGADRMAWLGGLLFVVHPLAVESVAWITELKNTLSLPLLLGSLLCYMDFAESRRRGAHAAATGLFLAAMLCKTSVVMFPFALLLYLWWRRGRVTMFAAKTTAPFFVISFALGLLTVWFQQHHALNPAEGAPFDPIGGWGARIACAGSVIGFYLWKTLLPVGLLPIYPQWPVNPPPVLLLLIWPALAALLAVCWSRRATWGRHALLGLGWFLLILVPVLGFVPISSQRFTWVMDHLAYVPLLGLIGLAVGGLEWLTTRVQPVVATAGAVVVSVALAAGARSHASHFRSEDALWLHTIEHNPQAWMALYNLGNSAGKAGHPAEAIAYYRRALQALPNYPEAANNLGNELRKTGQTDAAIAAYREAIRLKPDHPGAHNNLGGVLADAGRFPEAIAECEKALQLKPDLAPAERNLGNILTRAGRAADAIPHLEHALKLDPQFAEAENDLAVALGAAGRPRDSVPHFETALRLKPDYPEAQNNYGSTLRDLGDRAGAEKHLRAGLQLRPDYAGAHYNLGCVLLDAGQTGPATAEFERAVQLAPGHADAHFNLGNQRALAGRTSDALAEFDAALKARPAFPEALHNSAVLLTQTGQFAAAVTRDEQALQLKPDYADAHLNCAMALQSLGRMPEAIAHYEAARKLRPDLPPLK